MAANPGLEIISKPCPLLVPLVEDGRFSEGCTVTELLVEEYVSPLLKQNIDTLILGCTHFPHFKDALAERTALPLVDPAEEMVRMLLA